MYTIVPRKGEDIAVTLKRLKSKVLMDGLMEDLYRLRSYETTREKKKRKLRIRHKMFRQL